MCSMAQLCWSGALSGENFRCFPDKKIPAMSVAGIEISKGGFERRGVMQGLQCMRRLFLRLLRLCRRFVTACFDVLPLAAEHRVEATAFPVCGSVRKRGWICPMMAAMTDRHQKSLLMQGGMNDALNQGLFGVFRSLVSGCQYPAAFAGSRGNQGNGKRNATKILNWGKT